MKDREREPRAKPFVMSWVALVVAFVAACGPVDSSATASSARTWATEIDVCVEATQDQPGCQWLAGVLLQGGCAMDSYQTFAAALSIGGAFQDVYAEAVAKGDCRAAMQEILPGR